MDPVISSSTLSLDSSSSSLLLSPSSSLSVDSMQGRQATDPIIFIVSTAMWDQLQNDINVFWLINMGSLVFLMQLAFPLLEAGMVRSKSVVNLLFKNMANTCVGCAGWYLLGYAFAYGDTGNSFIGVKYFGLQDLNGPGQEGTFIEWFYSFTFAVTATTIASGSMAERTQLVGYSIFSFLYVIFGYAIVAHWIWSEDGWLGAYQPNPPISTFGCLDFAGGLVVHLVGGVAGMVGTIALGPRLGRFDNDGPKPQGHNLVLVAEGTMICWFGFFGFNCGSTNIITDGLSNVASLAAVNTIMGPAFAGMSALLFALVIDRKIDLGALLNGVLAGLVTSTSNCGYVEVWGQICVSIVGGIIYQSVTRLLIRIKVDDPIDVIPVHAACGIWSAIGVGLFASLDKILAVHTQFDNLPPGTDYEYGLFMGGGGRQLAAEIVGICVVFTWSLVVSCLIFLPLKIIGLLRVPVEEERLGLDEAKHGGHAYPEHSLIMRTLATRLLANKE